MDLTGAVGTAVGGVAGLFFPDVVARAVLARDAAWQAVYARAKLCEVLADPTPSPTPAPAP